MRTPQLIVALLCAASPRPLAAATEDDFSAPGLIATVVAAGGMDCSDYFAVKVGDSYALLQWFAGPKPQKGDTLHGDLNHYGLREILIEKGGTVRAYVEDYDLSMDDANDKLKEKCN